MTSCELCSGAAITRRYVESDEWWVADCATCEVPMVVARAHGTDVDDRTLVSMLAALDDAGADRYGSGVRWIVDARRRSIPGHWHAHARPVGPDEEWSISTRHRLRSIAARSSSTPPAEGWRTWELDYTGGLRSAERRVPWPSAHHTATCGAKAGPPVLYEGRNACASAPGPECYCGVAYFATLADAQEALGFDSPTTGRAWGLIDATGTVRRDLALLGATWRCEIADVRALVVGPADTERAAELGRRYAVPVLVAEADSVGAIRSCALEAGLAAVGSGVAPAATPRLVDLVDAAPEQIAGAAFTTPGLGAHLISYVPTRDGADRALDPADPVPGARFTWYSPGVHRLALTGKECDAILAADAAEEPSIAGGYVRSLEVDGSARWVEERLVDVVTAANAAWWRLGFDRLRGVGIRTQRAGSELPWHTDATPLDPQFRLSVVALLSDPSDFDGGRLEFLHDVHPTHPPMERGSVVVFPSTLLHSVTEVTRGERKTLVALARSTHHRGAAT